ncbi:MAG: hypothetical protein ABI573_10645 [Chloroflexota bacterium]
MATASVYDAADWLISVTPASTGIATTYGPDALRRGLLASHFSPVRCFSGLPESWRRTSVGRLTGSFKVGVPPS